MRPELLLDGLQFGECPRWRDGKLWFSDIFAQRVMTVDETGRAEVEVELVGSDHPAGLGFLPDGRLLIVNMGRPVVLRRDAPGSLTEHADISHLASGVLNDMAVDRAGRAYIGANGTDHFDDPRPLRGTGNIILVEPDGAARVVADEVDAPNGPCLTPDERTYIVSELPAAKLLAFDRAPDGSLSKRRIWADLSPLGADGITIDFACGVWAASPRRGRVLRVVEGGKVTDEVVIEGKTPVACCLGGADGRTLFILSYVGPRESVAERTCTSVIETVRVEIPA